MRPRRASALLAAAAAVVPLLAAPAASADRVTVAPPAEPPAAAAPFEVRVAVETAGGGRLVVDRRPASEPACGPTPIEDHPSAFVDHLTPRPLEIAASTTLALRDAIDEPGEYRYCAWLAADLLTVRAPVAEARVRVRPLAVSVRLLRIGRLEQAPLEEATMYAEVAGRSEGRSTVAAVVVPPYASCPRDLGVPGDETLEMYGPLGFVGPGRFRLRFVTKRSLPPGRWRVCVAMRDVLSSERIGAADTALHQLMLRPYLEPGESVGVSPEDDRHPALLDCRTGVWAGVPTPRVTFVWQRARREGGPWRRMSARSRLLRVWRTGVYRCVVTAASRGGRVVRASNPMRITAFELDLSRQLTD